MEGQAWEQSGEIRVTGGEKCADMNVFEAGAGRIVYMSDLG